MTKQFSYNRLCTNIENLNYKSVHGLEAALEKYKNYLPENRQRGFIGYLKPKTFKMIDAKIFESKIILFADIIEREKMHFRDSHHQKLLDAQKLKIFGKLGT